MSFKTKALGLVAATALSLSLASGVMAETTTIDADAILTGGDCTLDLSSDNGSFGTWTYNGETMEYETTDSALVTLTADIVEGDPLGCNVTIAFSGLDKAADGDSIIDIGLDHFNASFNGTQIDPIPASHDFGIVHTRTDTIAYRLVDVPNRIAVEGGTTKLLPGTYEGRITVTFQNVV